MKRRSLLKKTAAVLGGLALLLPAAQGAGAAFPSRPLTLIVPFTPGGAADLFGRTVAERLQAALGQTVVVENRPGANTALAARALVAAPADGHTLLLAAASTLVLNPLLMKQPGYQPGTDTRTLSLMAELPLVMVVPRDLPVATLSEFRRYAAANDGKLNYASVGVGSTMHLTGELFSQIAGIHMTHVAYKGSAPAMTDLLENRVQMMFDAPSSSMPQVAAGKLKALAVTTRQRMALLKDVPSIGETVPGFDTGLWYGITVRKATPPEVAERLKSALDQIQADPAVRAKLENVGFVMRQPASTKQIDEFLAAEDKRWSELIRARAISLD